MPWHWKKRRLTPGEQMLGMLRFPTLRLVDRARMIWRGTVQPSDGGRAFLIEVHANWHGRGLPRVVILSPILFADPGTGRPPHTYEDGALCLYHSSDFWWTGDHLLAETIVPWACEWCFYYEEWERTGRWLGPEYPHDGPKEDVQAPRPARPQGRVA